VVGGLLAGIVWPLTILSLYISVVSKGSRGAMSAAPAMVGFLPQGLPPENGRSDGPIRTLPDMWSDDPSASEGHVGGRRIAAALLEAPPRDHARRARGT
jgi:hypothetical protein